MLETFEIVAKAVADPSRVRYDTAGLRSKAWDEFAAGPVTT